MAVLKDAPADGGPAGELSTRNVAMPADTNPAGDIFGGWLLAQMDIAGGIVANRRAGGRTATVAVDAMKFHLPVFVGDILCCYAEIVRVGTSSIAVKIEAWAEKHGHPTGDDTPLGDLMRSIRRKRVASKGSSSRLRRSPISAARTKSS